LKNVLIDTHTHLDFDQFDADRDEVVCRAKEDNVAGMITIGTDLQTSRKNIEIACSYHNVFAAAGIHPHDAGNASEEDFEELYEMYSHPRVVAIGEVGLDYYRNLTKPDIQRRVFRRFLQWARELDKPLIIHTREAEEEIIAILRDMSKKGWRGVFHCFPGDMVMAEKVMDMGFYISFTGSVTFKNSTAAEIAKNIPLERLLLETDCPFMTPVPHRGKRNEPAFVQYVAQKIAELRAIPVEQVAGYTTANALELFGITLVEEE